MTWEKFKWNFPMDKILYIFFYTAGLLEYNTDDFSTAY